MIKDLNDVVVLIRTFGLLYAPKKFSSYATRLWTMKFPRLYPTIGAELVVSKNLTQ